MSGDEFEGFALVDLSRSAWVCDVGAHADSVAAAVTNEGRDIFWFAEDAGLSAEQPWHGNGDQSHEWMGPLPDCWRQRIAAALFRCGRPCTWHSELASAP